jgi:hypothetical protein
MKDLKVNWEKLSQYIANQEMLYNEAPESYKDQIEYLLISYIDGSEDYEELIQSFTKDPDKQELILIELHEYYNLFFLDNDCEIDDEYYKKNIFRIINN